MSDERKSLIIRVLTGNFFIVNIFGSLLVSFLVWIIAQGGDPVDPSPKNNGLSLGGVITIIFCVIFIFSFFLVAFWSIKKQWSGYWILVISVLHLVGIGLLHIDLPWRPDDLFFEMFLILPAFIDIIVITLTSLILFRKSINLTGTELISDGKD